MGRTQKNGDWTRSSLMYFLEIHDKGATAPELSAYTDIVTHQVLEQLHTLESQGKVYSTPYDRNSQLWHLKPEARTIPKLTPAAQTRVPGHRAGRSR